MKKLVIVATLVASMGASVAFAGNEATVSQTVTNNTAQAGGAKGDVSSWGKLVGGTLDASGGEVNTIHVKQTGDQNKATVNQDINGGTATAVGSGQVNTIKVEQSNK